MEKFLVELINQLLYSGIIYKVDLGPLEKADHIPTFIC